MHGLSSVARQRYKRGEVIQCNSLALIPGRTRRWKRERKKVGNIWVWIWIEVPGSEDPVFRHNLDVIAESSATTSRRFVRSTRTTNRHSLHEGIEVSYIFRNKYR